MGLYFGDCQRVRPEDNNSALPPERVNGERF